MENNFRERVRRTALSRLEAAQRAGVQQILKAPSVQLRPDQPIVDTPNNPEQLSGSSVSQEPDRFANTDAPTIEKMPTSSNLDGLQKEVTACTLCTELAETRNQTVFGVGDPNARLCFLGEAPGADEDRLGEPFVGRAGKLLTDIVQDGMKLERSEVYILNILKCRPPANRNPTPTEACNCRPFLMRQFELIRPEFICCLGAVAAQNLLETDTPIGKLRGSVHEWQGIRVICTYHPAYLLRNPSAKARTWEDIQLLMREMGI